MKKFKSLDGYQKGVLVVMLVMSLIFAVIYPKTLSSVGYRYNDAMLVQTQENGNTVYTGKIKGKQAQFIVSNNNTVVFNYGDKSYGQFTMKEDSTAIPDREDLAEQMIGIEIHNGDKLLFRGGVLETGDDFWLFDEDGTLNYGVSYATGDGIERDEKGDVIDRMMPSISTIYELLNNPALTHKGVALGWFVAVFISIINALSILFIDELFRFNLAFQIRNVDNAEPSDCELARRYIGWTIVTIMVLIIYIIGLQ